MLWALPKAVLFPLARGGTRRPERPIKELMQRLQWWEGGELDHLWAAAKVRSTRKDQAGIFKWHRSTFMSTFGESYFSRRGLGRRARAGG